MVDGMCAAPTKNGIQIDEGASARRVREREYSLSLSENDR